MRTRRLMIIVLVAALLCCLRVEVGRSFRVTSVFVGAFGYGVCLSWESREWQDLGFDRGVWIGLLRVGSRRVVSPQ